MTTAEDKQFYRVVAAGSRSLSVRKANPNYYWACRLEYQTLYYWDEVPVSRAEYIAAKGEDL